MAVYSYPLPRAPKYQKPTSVEDCLPRARQLVKQQVGRTAMGPVSKGAKILIVTYPDQDNYVKEAVTQVLKEEGAEKIDFIYEHELIGDEPRKFSAEDGWTEAETVDKFPQDMSGSTFFIDVADALRKYFDRHPDYTEVFYGLGGRPNLKFVLREHGSKFKNNWIFNNWEEYVSETWAFPDELWIEVERQVIEALGKTAAVRITDPEGTFLEYPLTEEEASRWQMGAWQQGHLVMEPFHATTDEGAMVPVSPEVPPVFRDLNGVLAGTSNHKGYFPRMELHFEHGRLVEVKDGGKYGELIRAMMDRYQDVHWPHYPDKGFFWYCDNALCTVVKAFRRTSDLFNSYWRLVNITERNRAGVFHMGIGSRRHFGVGGEEYLKYANEHNLPMGHIHVHNYFATFEIKIRGTQYWQKLVDKGRLSSLDDLKVRTLAVKYGNPDKLLSYDWIPPLPGINCEGEYLRDYAPDPASYLKRRMAENKPI